MISKARMMVGHYRGSPSVTTALTAIQMDLNLPQHKLVQDISTRWNSQVQMLERLIEQRTAVTLALSQSTNSNVPTNLTADAWTTAEELVVALRPFLDATILMSA